MSSRSRRKLPPKLVAARRGFARWRRRRKAGERIPDELWGPAVELAGELGLNRAARALGLDYYSLKRRVEAAGAENPGTSRSPAVRSAFVEVSAGAIPGPAECLVELEHPAGAKMRVSLKGSIGAELSALAGAFLKS